jgi:predicted site-specific integrase-resolvase
MSAHYVTYRKLKEVYDVQSETVRKWARQGLIRFKSIQHTTRTTWLYDMDSIGEFIRGSRSTTANESNTASSNVCRVLYARVSSKKQSDDLTRQIEVLTSRFPDTEIISDIGSGINYTKPGFSKLVDRICRGEIGQIVVTDKDRILRFGYELFERMCINHGCKILVLSKENPVSAGFELETEELQEDLLSIVNVFVARQNGRRSAQLRREKGGYSKRNNENKTISDTTSEGEVAADI